MPKKEFSEEAIPPFDAAPPVVAITGDVGFFVEEAAARARERLSAGDVEVLRFSEETPPGAAAEALLNRSLFSSRRLVEIDVSRLLGTDSPADLALSALEARERGTPAGKREAFRLVRRLLAALDLSAGDPEETASAVARKVKRPDFEEPLAELFAELPEEKSSGGATLASTLRQLLARGNDGLVALLTAASPPKGAGLLAEIDRTGLLLEVRIAADSKEIEPALTRLALARAKELDVRIEPAAIARLRLRTNSRPAIFATELEKLLDWAGEGGQIRAADVGEQVADEASEDVFAFFEAVGRRDASDALARLERLFSGREIRAGKRSFEPEDNWPQRFLGMLTDEIRRMLLVLSRLAEKGAPAFDPRMSFDRYKDRVAPWLDEPLPPFGKSPFGGRADGYPMYKAAGRATHFTAPELAHALARAAEVDVQLKTSAPILETLTSYVGSVIAGGRP